MYSSFDAPQDQPGRHRLVHKRTRALTPPRAAGFLVAASLTVLGITAIHQDLSDPDTNRALSAGPGALNPPAAGGAPSLPSSAYDNNAPAPDTPAPDAPTPAQFLAQSTPSPQPQQAGKAASAPSSKVASAPGGQSAPTRHTSAATTPAPAPSSSNGTAAQPATASGPTAAPANTAPSNPPPASSTAPSSPSQPAPVLSQVVGTVTGVLGGL